MSMLTPSSDTFAEGLARELAEYCALERSRRSTAPVHVPPALSPECLRALALLRSDLLHVASVMCIPASLANRTSKQLDDQVADGTVLPFEPTFSAVGLAAAGQLADTPGVFDVTQHWQNVSARLKFAINISQTFVGSQERKVRSSEREIIADAWQHACAAMLGLHACLMTHMTAAGLVCDERVEAVPLDMLRAAARGEEPCIDAEGHLSVPGWAERRRKPRRNRNMPVQLEVGSNKSHAVLVDVSAMGLGLQFPTLVPQYTSARVWLSDGRELKGVVSWSKGGRLGVRLDHPLEADDHLLN